MKKKKFGGATRVGVVISTKMDKTAVVMVERKFIHPLYKATVVKRRKYKAHDENNVCQVGDVVLIRESRPISKTKRWRVSKILKKAKT